MNYKEEQVGWLIVGFLPFFILLIFLFYILEIGDNPIPLSLTIVFIFLAIISLLLFYKLTITIDDDYVKIVFGIGLIRKKVPIKDIAAVKRTRTKWYNGWGIRYVRKGTLYNIHGFQAIELTFKNSPRRILIGTKSNSKLENEIQKRIENNTKSTQHQ